MSSVEADLNKTGDSTNDSIESFEDAIEHLEVPDDSPMTVEIKTALNTSESNVSSENIFKDENKKFVNESQTNIDEISEMKTSASIEHSSEKIEREKEKMPSSDYTKILETKTSVNVDIQLPASSNENSNSSVISITDKLDSITNNLADVHIDKEKSESTSSVLDKPVSGKNISDEKGISLEGQSMSVESIMTIAEKTVDDIVNAIPVEVPVKKLEERETPTEESLSKKSIEGVNDSRAELSDEQHPMIKPTENISSTTESKEICDDKVEVAINGDHVPDSLTEDINVVHDRIPNGVPNEIKAEVNNYENEENLSEDDGTSIKSERVQGDGQGEQEEAKELGLDEDKRNPEYIPRKGAYYEHDTRTMDDFDDDTKQNEEEVAIKSKRKPKAFEAEGRWTHDKFHEQEQHAKSTQEIIDTYGYDIRNEEHPPRTRRSRHYGRGPGKYNRNWKDEKAYIKNETKPRIPSTRDNRNSNDRPRSNRNSENDHRPREEFPPLMPKNNDYSRDEIPYREEKQPLNLSNKKAPSPTLHYSDKIGMKKEKGAWTPPPPFSQKNVVQKEKEEKPNQSAVATKDVQSPSSTDLSKPSIDSPTSPGVNKVPSTILNSFQRPRQRVETPPHWFHQKVETTAPPDLVEHTQKDMNKLPGVLGALRGGKRYSVQRQQSLPESQRNSTVQTTTPSVDIQTMTADTSALSAGQNLPTSAFYHHAPTGTGVPITVPQSSPSHLVFTQSPPPSNPAPAPALIKGDYVIPNMTGETPIYHSNSYQPATNVHANQKHHLTNGVPSAGGPIMVPVPVQFIQPPPSQVPNFTPQPAAPFNAPPQPSFTNQPQTTFTNQPQPNFANQPQAPPAMMGFAPQTIQFQPMQSSMVSMPPQQEVFQPAGGITYYSPQTQAVLQRPALSKRVKSAIPIVPPNEVQQVPNNLQSNIVSASPLQQAVGVLPQQLVPLEINQEDPFP